MQESTKHWRKKHPNIHRPHSLKRNRDFKKNKDEQLKEIGK